MRHSLLIILGKPANLLSSYPVLTYEGIGGSKMQTASLGINQEGAKAEYGILKLSIILVNIYYLRLGWVDLKFKKL